MTDTIQTPTLSATADAGRIRVGATARPVPAPATRPAGAAQPAATADTGRIRLGATARLAR